MYKNIKLFICIFCLLISSVSHAALVAKGSAKLVDGFNPHPHKDDIILPMPCNLSMVFKLVGVPAQGFLWDMHSRFGSDVTSSVQRVFYDSRHSINLAAPFSGSDLPQTWKKYAPSGNYFYYFMGKYEVSSLQYDAIMNKICPEPNDANIRPKADLTWFEAIEFSQKYTEWLLESSPQSLPRFRGDSRNIGFLRLPTESEWEYAARGGHTSTSQEFLENDFFILKEGENYEDYAIYRPENVARIAERAARIGSRKPNPLGLYDTAGNVAEMVLDVFRFSLGGRLHGSAGGFVRKGGSYLSGQGEILPGRREEVAFFQLKGAVAMRDMGFRLVLSGINTPGGGRQDILQKEWDKAGDSSAAVLNKNNDPLDEINRLITAATSEVEKKNYEQIRSLLKENYISFERQQLFTAASEIRTLGFIIETIKNIYSRIKIIESTLPKVIRMKNDDEALGKDTSKYNKVIEKSETGIKNFRNAIEQSLLFYKTKIDDIRYMNPRIVNSALDSVKNELKKSSEHSVFHEKLYENILMFQQHLAAIRAHKFDALSTKQLHKDILGK